MKERLREFEPVADAPRKVLDNIEAFGEGTLTREQYRTLPQWQRKEYRMRWGAPETEGDRRYREKKASVAKKRRRLEKEGRLAARRK